MTHPRFALHAIAVAALFGAASCAYAATATEPVKSAAATPAAAAAPVVKHHPVRRHFRAVAPAPVRWIQGDALAQARLSSGIARDRIGPTEVAMLETRAAGVYRDQASTLAAPLTRSSQTQVAVAGRGFLRAVDHAAWTKTRVRREDAMDRMHERVAAARDAEQQRWIANRLDHRRLTPGQVSTLEATQADIVTAQATLARQGHETIDDALRMQHRQDVQDWAIRTGHAGVDVTA